MEISDLLGKLKGADKSKPQPFLALEITDEVVVAAVWQVENGQTAIVSVGTPVEWDGDKEDGEELVRAADATVSNAIEGLELEPGQIIFGVAPSWAGPNGILPAKIALIKRICKDLELKPLGFVVITDSLLRYLKMQEGTPANSIFVHVARDTVTVTVVRMGKVEASESMGRGDDLASDVVEGLSRFAGEAELPSRILVYDGMHNIEEEVQNLLSYDWKSTFNFLHIPKIETLPKDVVIRSIAVAGGAEVAKAIGFDIVEPVPAPAPAVTVAADKESQEESETEIEAEDEMDDQDLQDAGNVEPVDEEVLSAADFGFAEPHKKLPPVATRVTLVEDDESTRAEDGDSEETEQEEAPAPPNRALPKLKLPVVTLPRVAIPRLRMPDLSKMGLIVAVVIFLLIAAASSVIWLVPKATVTIYVEPKTLPETTTITLDTTATTANPNNAVVPATPVEKIVSGQDSVPATGKKTIGDAARGEVTMYNRTSLTKTFKAGTVLTAKSLKFTIDSDVTVASKSAGVDYVDVPGKATAKITAKAIGGDSNLGEDTEFTIENFGKDSYVAKNSSALSGGSSREVQVVDKSDKANLSKALHGKLIDQGKAELVSELGGSKGVYVMTKGSTIEEEKYSADVGAEATELSGTMTVKVKGVSYSPQDVEGLMAATLESAIPSGYTKTGELPTVDLGEVKSETESSVEISATITINLVPDVDVSTVQEALRGVAPAQVEAALTSVVGLKGAQVAITPQWLNPRFKRMPRNPANIAVTIVSAQ